MPGDGAQTRNRIMDVAQQMVLDVGLVGTSVEKVIDRVGVTKGTFFYHFKTEHDLAAALIERYADADQHHFADTMNKAEQLARDPLQQLLIFVGLFIEMTEQLEEPFPGCLYVSYCYQSGAISRQSMAQVERMMFFWRERLGEKIEHVIAGYPPRIPVKAHQVADHVLTTFEGGVHSGQGDEGAEVGVGTAGPVPQLSRIAVCPRRAGQRRRSGLINAGRGARSAHV